MFRCFKILLVLLTVISSFLKAEEISHNQFTHLHSDINKVSVLNSIASAAISFPCEDCENEGCSDSSNCCQSFCTCSFAFILNVKNQISNTISPAFSTVEWYLNKGYRSPYLDHALKPPLLA